MGKKRGERVSMDDLFCMEFMKNHTNFDSFLAFLQAGFDVGSLADFDAIQDAAFERYVAKSTVFSNWEEMLETAKKHFIEKYVAEKTQN